MPLSRYVTTIALVLAFVALAWAPAFAQQPSPGVAAQPDPIWLPRRSCLPQDPKLRTGVLPNGFRYAVLPNKEPKDRIVMSLLIAAGSLHERDDQRGLAHFVEHMAYRGTRTHPDNSLTEEMQRRGIGFGAENSAFTGYDWTTFNLELPDTKEETLLFGLKAFHEYADEISFAKKAIERERGVIAAERSARAHPSLWQREAKFGLLFPDSRYSKRSPIGDPDIIAHCSARQLKEFYDTWYRPERMAVIIVGDVSADTAEALVKSVFGPLCARAKAATTPPDLIPEKASPPSTCVYIDRTSRGVGIYLEHPQRTQEDTGEPSFLRDTLATQLAFEMIRKRLADHASKNSDRMSGPMVMTSIPMSHWQIASISIGCSLAGWKETISDLEKEHRRTFLHGFCEEELTTIKAVFANRNAEAVRTAPSRPSSFLNAHLMGSLLYGTPFCTPEDYEATTSPLLKQITVAECLRAFRKAWTTAPPHVFLVVDGNFKEKPEKVAIALNASREIPVEPFKAKSAVNFAYTDWGPPCEPSRHNFVADLDVHQAEWPNRIRLNFKSTSYSAKRVDVYVGFGTGRMTIPDNEAGLDILASMGFFAGGVHKHSTEELRSIFLTRSISLNLMVDNDSCILYASAPKHELQLCLQLICAYLTDAAFRQEGLNTAQSHFGGMYTSLGANPSGAITLQAFRHLIKQDTRYCLPFAGELYQRSMSDLRNWLNPQLKVGDLEMSIVGDITWDEARNTVAQTLGTLPKRNPRADLSPIAKVEFAEPSNQPVFIASIAQKPQVAFLWAWPVPKQNDIRHERRCRVLAEVLGQALFRRVRDELGASYTPAVDYRNHDGIPDFNFFLGTAEVNLTHTEATLKAMREEVAKLREGKLSTEAFNQAKQPFLMRRQKDLTSNAYWGYTVLRDAQRRPDRLEAARNRTADCEAITKENVLEIAKEYFTPENLRLYISHAMDSSREAQPLRNHLLNIFGR